MVEIGISERFKSACIQVRLGCLMGDVEVKHENVHLWDEINQVSGDVLSKLKIENVSQLDEISASRKAYKVLGKDPARYRLSAEALLRRIINGYGLYRVNNVVDIVNLISIKTGFSIGGYDFDKIQFPVKLCIGKDSDQYEGIGRGLLNIESLPVLRDHIGAFGSPTSDSVRTSVSDKTKCFLMVIFGFGTETHIHEALNYADLLFTDFAYMKNKEKWIVELQ